MTSARFHAAGWMPAALTDALNRIETACFTDPLSATAMREEVRAGLRAARDALTDAAASYAAQVAALNTALGLRE
jgi:hypothetical protein